MREVVLDTETTGLDPSEGHRIVEIGAVEIVHQVATGKTFHRIINPERDVPDDAVRVHGHAAASLKDKPIFADVVDALLEFIAESRLIIHNAEFDIHFLNTELARIGRETIEPDRVFDTLGLARQKHPGLHNSLDALCDRYSIDRSRRSRHGALLDAELLAELYTELTGGIQRSFVFENPRLPELYFAPTQMKARIPRRSTVPDAEAALHDRYVTALGQTSIWSHFGAAVTPATSMGRSAVAEVG